MKKIIGLTAGILFSVMIYAQDSSHAVVSNKLVQVDVGFGFLNTNMSSINSSFKDAGLKPMKENYTTVSIGSSFFLKRVLLRTEVSMIMPNHVDQANHVTTEFNGFVINASAGYSIWQTQRFRLTPYVGISAFNTHLKFNDRTPATTFEEVVNTPRRNTRITFSNSALDFGIQADKILVLKNNKWDCPQNTRYMTLGLRAGYNWCPGNIKARYNGTVISGAPEYNFQGPYVKLVASFGTRIRQMRWR